ncbi:septum formation initiator family protein [Plantibacter sp. T3]|uniref:septum formation initiator family protein n=1 Tax=Plantibacter sp. T3 TaxID=2653161 RepID=UPI001357ED70|nr:septum formation initiator family protein [Plantibacter sp. T3]
MKKPSMPAGGESKPTPSGSGAASSSSSGSSKQRPASKPRSSSADASAKRASSSSKRPTGATAKPARSAGTAPRSTTKAPRSASAGSSAPRSRTGSTRTAPARQSDAGGWLRSLRLSGFSVLLLGILVLGVVVLAPNLKTFLEQRQQIAALEAGVADTQKQVDAQQAERERWNDQSYVMTQARDRLFYALPGEVSYIIINDVDPASLPTSETPVSDTLVDSQSDWLDGLLSSLVATGYSPAPVATETPAPTQTTPPAGG